MGCVLSYFGDAHLLLCNERRSRSGVSARPHSSHRLAWLMSGSMLERRSQGPGQVTVNSPRSQGTHGSSDTLAQPGSSGLDSRLPLTPVFSIFVIRINFPQTLILEFSHG